MAGIIEEHLRIKEMARRIYPECLCLWCDNCKEDFAPYNIFRLSPSGRVYNQHCKIQPPYFKREYDADYNGSQMVICCEQFCEKQNDFIVPQFDSKTVMKRYIFVDETRSHCKGSMFKKMKNRLIDYVDIKKDTGKEYGAIYYYCGNYGEWFNIFLNDFRFLNDAWMVKCAEYYVPQIWIMDRTGDYKIEPKCVRLPKRELMPYDNIEKMWATGEFWKRKADNDLNELYDKPFCR